MEDGCSIPCIPTLPFVSPIRSSTRHDEHGHPTGSGGEAEVLPNRTRTDPSQGQRRSHHQRTHTCRTDTRSRTGHGEKHTCEQIPTVTKRKEKKRRKERRSLLPPRTMECQSMHAKVANVRKPRRTCDACGRKEARPPSLDDGRSNGRERRNQPRMRLLGRSRNATRMADAVRT